MYKYSSNTGELPKIGDRVKVFNLNEKLNGKTGTVTGWGDILHDLIIVTFDIILEDGISTVSIPVVVVNKI